MICSAGWPTATSKCALTRLAETAGFNSAGKLGWWRRELSITASVSTSSPISGGRQTVITKSSAPCVAASSSAVSNAFFPDGDPSYATRILLYTNQLRGVSCAEGLHGMTRSDSSVFGSRWRGTNQILAIRVGTTALAITAATRAEYCVSVTMPCDKPNSEEMVPNVRPVDISSVVYIASFRGDRNA